MQCLPIVNDRPRGAERRCNAPRLAHALARHDHGGIVPALADAVPGPKPGQKTPAGDDPRGSRDDRGDGSVMCTYW